MHIFAMIMAAGSGKRMAGETPKQLLPIAGKPMLAWSLRRIADRRNVPHIMVVTSPGARDAVRDALAGCGADDVDLWVEGGERRQDSVRLGLAALPAEATHVIIHDAARPCLTDALLQRILDALRNHDAVVPALPAVDTLLWARDSVVQGIIDRSEVSAAQTPQAFEVGLIREAHEHAHATGYEANDDGTLVLELEKEVTTVPGERDNFKVTYPGDEAIAAAILGNRTDI